MILYRRLKIMNQVVNDSGQIKIKKLPVPICGDNEILVKNYYSLISAGTETSSSSKFDAISLASNILKNKEIRQKGIELLKKQGFKNTLKIVKGSEGDKLAPLGYSCSGTVLKVGKNISDVSIGDRVACAGAGYANHAEVVNVPRNLICKIPENVDFSEAAFTTVGAIAMQGVRRAEIELGDKVVVIGLGLLGLIACQILNASGAHVIGIDIMPERLKLAKELGANICFKPGEESLDRILEYTEGFGADSVIIYAATKSNEPVKQAMMMARKRGKVVVVGDVGMDIDRSPFYEKELDFRISCSYGPGRYDPSYEERNIDYPFGYVRWTENRNMKEFLQLISEKKVNVKSLINHKFQIGDANEAYDSFNYPERPVGVLFEYNNNNKPLSCNKMELKSNLNNSNKINVALIGAGGFSKVFHLPNIKKIDNYNLKAIVSRTAINAKQIAEEYDAEYYTNDYKEIVQDKDIDMVLITTRHNLHAPIIVESAENNKNIFVEKPIAMNYEECEEVYDSVKRNKVNLTVGFNRRLSPLAQEAKKLIDKRSNPLMITYRINSAGMNKDHWINDPVEGGGTIIGEACHFFDFCNWMIGKDPQKLSAEMISSNNECIIDNNNFVGTIKYDDGSVASIIYNTIGNESYSKERIEIFCDGNVISINDFQEIEISGYKKKYKKLKKIDKGHFEIIDQFGKIILGDTLNKDIPTVEDGIKATICSLKIMDSLKSGKIQKWDYNW